MSDFLLPSLGADMESARVVEWLVAVGDEVHSGDLIALIETDKGLIDVEVFEDGVIESLIAPLDQDLPVGTLLARIRNAGAAAPGAAARAPDATAPQPAAPQRAAASAAAASVATHSAGAVRPRTSGAHSRASPAARRRALELGLDLSTLSGSGPLGAVQLADVEAAQAPTPRERRPGGIDASAMRRAIGAAMSRAKREIPHYYLSQPVCLANALAWLETRNQALEVSARLLPAVLLLRASALAVAQFPAFNGRYENDSFTPADGVHVGWAVALRGGGLIAPAIHHADQGSLDELMARLRNVIKRARGGGLRSSELMDAGITVTSLGERGAESVWPIIYPPQVAMLGFGRIGLRPWVIDERVVALPAVNLSLAADHRVSDGHAGSLLLAAVADLLEKPESMVDSNRHITGG